MWALVAPAVPGGRDAGVWREVLAAVLPWFFPSSHPFLPRKGGGLFWLPPLLWGRAGVGVWRWPTTCQESLPHPDASDRRGRSDGTITKQAARIMSDKAAFDVTPVAMSFPGRSLFAGQIVGA